MKKLQNKNIHKIEWNKKKKKTNVEAKPHCVLCFDFERTKVKSELHIDIVYVLAVRCLKTIILYIIISSLNLINEIKKFLQSSTKL